MSFLSCLGFWCDVAGGPGDERGALTPLLEDHEVTLSTFDAAAWLVFPARRYIPARVRAVTELLSAHLQSPAEGPP